MTRINANINPKKLKRMHLIAEYREITMVPASLRRSLRTKTKDEVLASIPNKFTLNKGHVKFFYNKMLFLKTRFLLLCLEMERRGYQFDHMRGVAFSGFDDEFYCDWQATEDDNDIVHERIALRISQKPHLYKN